MTGKETSAVFASERRLDLCQWQYDRLEKIMRAIDRLYNATVKHCEQGLEKLKQDKKYQKLRKDYREAESKTEKNEIAKQLQKIEEEYGLAETDVQAYVAAGCTRSYKGCVQTAIGQKIGKRVYQSLKKAIRYGTKMHYRKLGQDKIIERIKQTGDKTKNFGLKYFINQAKTA